MPPKMEQDPVSPSPVPGPEGSKFRTMVCICSRTQQTRPQLACVLSLQEAAAGSRLGGGSAADDANSASFSFSLFVNEGP